MKPINPKDLKIRASQIWKVCGVDRSASLTDKQEATLKDLESRETLTENQQKELTRLQEKRDKKPELSEGGKSYIKSLFYEHVSGTRKVFTSKYTDKGNIKENQAIAEVCKYLRLPIVVKNEKYFKNKYAHGTPDTILKPLNLQMDVKSPYYPDGLDVFDTNIDKEYEWQQHCYNWMVGVDNAIVAKVLMNPPESILERETYTMAKVAGVFPITDDFAEEVREYFDYESRMPLEDRVNVYTLTTNDEHIKTMKNGVELAREYYAELVEAWGSKNDKEINFVNQLLKR